ncbi:hypothetical protein HLH26_00085 [Gluconacetobacter sp. 1b LMG 1731]|uniref:Uncharacterized protein n=1 Tax=Gluconacetobacter dulcium TaxID=2729096 RepID=A0A7W4JZ19_9PROT|nr:hypothetical protein [Gluconacetobacter dulcium]MBB2162953.1 hypothetical protein [Gluconacetobacter dulcium]MBB2192352.1 hypothetical protein [Gluconacetobacter dulcium]MBB2197329.1 hypothetical protein [Gluconacetobacter dulcium]
MRHIRLAGKQSSNGGTESGQIVRPAGCDQLAAPHHRPTDPARTFASVLRSGASFADSISNMSLNATIRTKSAAEGLTPIGALIPDCSLTDCAYSPPPPESATRSVASRESAKAPHTILFSKILYTSL